MIIYLSHVTNIQQFDMLVILKFYFNITIQSFENCNSF